MKNLFLFLIFTPFLLFGQTDYSKKWKIVEDKINKGEYKSLQEDVQQIYAEAKAENNVPQQIKSTLFLLEVLNETEDEEDTVLALSSRLINEIKSNKGVDKAIWQEALAKFYVSYISKNQWTFRDRTYLTDNTSTDFRTWHPFRFLQVADTLLVASTQETKAFDEDIKTWEAIIEGDKDLRKYRPTLKDIINHDAIDLYKNSSFTNSSFDEGIIDLRISKLYAELRTYHGNNKNWDALVYNILEQAEYDYDQDNNTEKFKTELKEIIEEYPEVEWTSMAYVELANLILSESDPNKVDVVSLLKEAIKKYPNSKGAEFSKNLLYNIEAEYASFSTDIVALPKHPIYLNIEHTNLSEFYISAYEFKDKSERIDLNVKPELGTKVWTHPIVLKNFKDYNNHSTNVIVPQLPTGTYLFEISKDKNGKEVLSKGLVKVSAYEIVKRQDNNVLKLLVLNRETGEPAQSILVNAYKRDGYSRNIIYDSTYQTNENGEVEFDPLNHLKNYLFSIKDEDVILNKEYYYDYNNGETNDNWIEVKYFFDKKIYRPGELVHLKVIALNKDELKANEKINLELLASDYSTIETKSVVTNSFGSAYVSFQLPTDLMNGYFRIKSNYSEEGFMVESYKRPSFKIEFEENTEAYQLGDSIQVQGSLYRFSGGQAKNQKIQFKIHENSYNDPYYRHYPTNRTLIKGGESLTNNEGKFSFEFLSSKEDLFSNFKLYRIEVIATDNSGDTQTESYTVSVGKNAIVLNVDIKDSFVNIEEKKLEITTQNFNGKDAKAEVEVVIEELSAPLYLLREQQHITDYQSLTFDEWKDNFPYLQYLNEANRDNWKSMGTAFEESFSINGNKTLEIPINKAGYYKLTAYALPKSDSIVSTHYFEVINTDKNELSQNILSLTTSKEKYLNNETVAINILSAAPNAKVFVEIIDDNKRVYNRWVQLKDGSKTIEFDLKAIVSEHVLVFAHIFYGNHLKGVQKQIDILKKQDSLIVKKIHFKDELKPNQKEEWSFLITHANGQPADAEVLAGMYDLSLNQLAENNWRFDLNKNDNTYFPLWNADYVLAYFNNFYNSDNRRTHSSLDFENFEFSFNSNRSYGNSHMKLSSSISEVPEAQTIVTSSNFAVDASSDMRYLKDSGIITKMIPTEPAKVRDNFKETAFFYPQLNTNDKGEVQFSFTTPDDLTDWKFQILAHTKDLMSVYLSDTVATRKDLSVDLYTPRFLRQGDQISLRAIVKNLTDKKSKGTFIIEFKEHNTQTELSKFNQKIKFSIPANDEEVFIIPLDIPMNSTNIEYTIVADSKKMSDSKRSDLIVLSNKVEVVDTKAITLNKGQKFEFITEADTAEQITLEVTSNPIWNAVLALPSLIEPEFKNATNLFNQWLAYSYSTDLVKENPEWKKKIQQYISKYSNFSQLEKNKAYKATSLKKTPWTVESKEENDNVLYLNELFNSNQIEYNKLKALRDLKDLQVSNGGFSWFKGGEANWWISAQILEGLGKSISLNATEEEERLKNDIILSLIDYVDNYVVEEKLLDTEFLNSLTDFFIARSYFTDFNPFPKGFEYKRMQLINKSIKNISKLSTSEKAKITQLCFLMNEDSNANKFLHALSETSVYRKDLGMYWKTYGRGNLINNVQEHASILQAYQQSKEDYSTEIKQMKLWLVNQKRIQSWDNSSATAEAVFALFNDKNDLQNENANVLIDGKKIQIEDDNPAGYYKKTWYKNDKNFPASIAIKNNQSDLIWGSLFLKSEQELDKVKNSSAQVKIQKELYKKTALDSESLLAITADTPIEIGDEIVIRLRLQVDRDFEFMHLRDYRAGGFEPTMSTSTYQWKNGLGYYETNSDTTKDFFMDYIAKGVYIFEYSVFATASGTFNNGYALLQSFYAPEFSAHSKGNSVKIKQ